MQIVVLAVIMSLAQCGPGGCPTPVRQAPYVRALPSEQPRLQLILPQSTPLRTPLRTPIPQSTPQAPPISEAPQGSLDDRDYGWYLVIYDDMILPVWGYHIKPDVVRWDASYSANVTQIERARVLYHEAWREQQEKIAQHPRKKSL